MGQLECLEIENFKSYEGNVTIGPFGRFTAIIGPNGSGKSNLMDAISFVLGEKSSNMRVTRLSQLIHGAPVGQAVASTATVTAVMKIENDQDELVEARFTRQIQGNGSIFKIDGRSYTAKEYQAKLEELNIFINSKNFLVYQGKVEEIALKNPKERMHMFEEISESNQYKEDYIRASKEQQEAEEETKDAHQKKKGMALERKEAKAEKELAESYRLMQEEYRNAQIQHSLFQLDVTNRKLEDGKHEIKGLKKQIEKTQKKKKEIEEEIKREKAESGKIQREVNSVEKKCEEKTNKLSNLKPQAIKARENTSHTQHKLESVRKRLEAAEKIHSQKQNIIQELQTQLKDLENRRKVFEAQIEDADEHNIELEQSQLIEYQKLKENVANKSAQMLDEIHRYDRERLIDQTCI
jgi:structural maintenance of chromosome 1